MPIPGSGARRRGEGAGGSRLPGCDRLRRCARGEGSLPETGGGGILAER